MNVTVTRFVSIVTMMVILVGCSPYIYKNEIAVFGESVEQSLNAMETEIEIVTRQDQDQAISDYYKKKAKLQFTNECVKLLHVEGIAAAKTLSDKCQIAFKVPNIPPSSLEPPALNKFRKVKNGLQRYSKGLVAITDARSMEELTAASQELTVSLVDLQAKMAQLDDESRKKVEATGTVIGEFITAAASIGLDNARYKVLKEQVNLAHPNIKVAAEWLKANATWYHISLTTKSFDQVRAISEATNKRLANLSAKDYEKQVDSLQELRDRFVALSTTSSAATMENLVKTHMALRDALNDKHSDVQRKAVVDNLKQLYDHVQTLRDAVSKAAVE